MKDRATSWPQLTYDTLGSGNDDNNEDENENHSNELIQQIFLEATTLGDDSIRTRNTKSVLLSIFLSLFLQ